MAELKAQVILLTGPSGSGKSHLAAGSGLPVLHLDHFYRDGDDPALPRLADLGIVDWDHPESWNAEAALTAVESACRTGEATVPVYDISADRATATERFDVGGAARFIAEGIFAAELIAACRDRGLLADAIVVTRAPWKNFGRRFARDLSEGRKSPSTLWRRGRQLMRAESAMVARQVALGCRPCDSAATRQALRQPTKAE